MRFGCWDGRAWDPEARDSAGGVQELTDSSAVGGALGRPRLGLSRKGAVCAARLVVPPSQRDRGGHQRDPGAAPNESSMRRLTVLSA